MFIKIAAIWRLFASAVFFCAELEEEILCRLIAQYLIWQKMYEFFYNNQTFKLFWKQKMGRDKCHKITKSKNILLSLFDTILNFIFEKDEKFTKI